MDMGENTSQVGVSIYGYRVRYTHRSRTLLVDVCAPLSKAVCKQICSGLENLITMVCSLSGQSCLPFLSIMTLGTHPEVLLPLQQVRGNFCQLQSAVKEIERVFEEERVACVSRLTDTCLAQALQDISDQFAPQSKTMTQTKGEWCQLEIVVISCQEGQRLSRQVEKIMSSIQLDNLKVSHSTTRLAYRQANDEGQRLSRQVEKIMSSIRLDNLRRIQVVSVLEDLMLQEDEAESAGSQRSSTSEASSESAGLGIIVDTVHIDNDSLSIQNYFASWLKDMATDREHLHISLPPPGPGTETLVLKCDLQDRLINPQLLPGLSLGLETQTLGPPSKPTQLGPGKHSPDLPLYHITVQKMLPASALCESVVFGMPLIVQPTSCWKIDWEDLEQNQQVFQSLCQVLIDKDMVLLGSSLIPSLRQKAVYQTVATSERREPTAWFVILPARSSLLIKSVAVKELMLPSNESFQIHKPDEESRRMVTDSLQQLEIIGIYNPLLVSSGLYDVLRSQYRKNDGRSHKQFNFKSQQTPSLCGKSSEARTRLQPGAPMTFKHAYPLGSLPSSHASFPTKL
ncbi:meiosis 1 arrest protein-like [Liolophura sinensis]|uniref:meiosis 1 arrest protein-like n=1 Tax=Liolophura sinensis TaxID=3198878 RepID=UPI003159359F